MIYSARQNTGHILYSYLVNAGIPHSIYVCVLLPLFKELPHTLPHLILTIIPSAGKVGVISTFYREGNDAWNKWPVFLKDDYLASQSVAVMRNQIV